jgi:hypothetical protein
MAGWLLVIAMMVIMVAAITWILLAVTASDYYSSSKAVRDAAEAGSTTLSQLRTIESVEAWVLPLAFVGLATFLLGFGFAFNRILTNIRLRGGSMAATLPALKKDKAGG